MVAARGYSHYSYDDSAERRELLLDVALVGTGRATGAAASTWSLFV